MHRDIFCYKYEIKKLKNDGIEYWNFFQADFTKECFYKKLKETNTYVVSLRGTEIFAIKITWAVTPNLASKLKRLNVEFLKKSYIMFLQ